MSNVKRKQGRLELDWKVVAIFILALAVLGLFYQNYTIVSRLGTSPRLGASPGPSPRPGFASSPNFTAYNSSGYNSSHGSSLNHAEGDLTNSSNITIPLESLITALVLKNPNMSEYKNISFTESSVACYPASVMKKLSESEPVVYGNVSVDACIVVLSSSDFGLIVVYDPNKNEILKKTKIIGIIGLGG